MGAKEQSRLEGFTQRGEETTPAVFEVSGSVKWFDPSKGYGFIVPDEDLADVLLHVTCDPHHTLKDLIKSVSTRLATSSHRGAPHSDFFNGIDQGGTAASRARRP